jgi:dinuclear metal center YbgI/SA1388 family protein
VTTLLDVVRALDTLYPPQWAEEWDAVGLVCGDPAAPVDRIQFAVDPTDETVDEAIAAKAQVLITHHPLLMRPVHSVAASTPKGRLIHRLIAHGVGLLVAHTNADVASPGVADALASRLGLRDVRPLRPRAGVELDKIVTFAPEADAERVVDALAAAGAGQLGAYSRCAWTTDGTGTFQPGPGARPAIGLPGERTTVAETRVEMVLRRHLRPAVIAALRAAHPYEEPAFDLTELVPTAGPEGIGRVGELAEPVSLRQFVAQAAKQLPATAAGLRAAGDPERIIRTVAASGGAGDGLLSEATASGADVFLAADLRHHPVSDHLAAGGPALVDAAHWATERPWLDDAATLLGRLLTESRGTQGATVQFGVSDLVTDPWSVHAPSRPEESTTQ